MEFQQGTNNSPVNPFQTQGITIESEGGQQTRTQAPRSLEGSTTALDQLEDVFQRYTETTLHALGFGQKFPYALSGGDVGLGDVPEGEGASVPDTNTGVGTGLQKELGAVREKTKSGLSRQQFSDLVRQATPLAREGQWRNLPDWSKNAALDGLVYYESGRSTSDKNPNSTAYGLFQFLDSTWAGTGVSKTSDSLLQTVAGLRYVFSRYRTPERAFAFQRATVRRDPSLIEDSALQAAARKWIAKGWSGY
jgi:hypothetical protein